MTAPSLVAVATATYRTSPADNQDAIGMVDNPRWGVRALLVADGLGSQAHSELGARWAVEGALEFLAAEARAPLDQEFLERLFAHARTHLQDRARDHCAREGLAVDPNQSFGTTLIIALEDPTCFWFGYVGNGGIWHLRGSFNEFLPNQYLPWNAISYLNPHSLQNEQGKEALYRLLSLASEDDARPTLLRLQKDPQYGDIVMICTDGIYSGDQLNIGRTRDGTTWIKVESPLLRFFTALDDFFAGTDTPDDTGLGLALTAYLADLRAEGLLTDDASLGVLVTAPVLRHQAQQPRRRPSSNA